MSSQLEFFRALDTLFANNTEIRRSSEGLVFYLFGGAIDQRAIKQTIVTKLSTEAELYSLSYVGTELIQQQRVIKKLRFELEAPLILLYNNKQTLRVVTKAGGKISTKMRHVDIQQCQLREQY